MPRLRTRDAFALIELLMVVLIVGILASVAIPTYAGQQKASRDAHVMSALRVAAEAAEAYFVLHDTYVGFPAAAASMESSFTAVVSNFGVLVLGTVGDPSNPGARADQVVVGNAAPGAPTSQYINLCATAYKASAAYCIKLTRGQPALYAKARSIKVAYDDVQVDTPQRRAGW